MSRTINNERSCCESDSRRRRFNDLMAYGEELFFDTCRFQIEEIPAFVAHCARQFLSGSFWNVGKNSSHDVPVFHGMADHTKKVSFFFVATMTYIEFTFTAEIYDTKFGYRMCFALFFGSSSWFFALQKLQRENEIIELWKRSGRIRTNESKVSSS